MGAKPIDGYTYTPESKVCIITWGKVIGCIYLFNLLPFTSVWLQQGEVLGSGSLCLGSNSFSMGFNNFVVVATILHYAGFNSNSSPCSMGCGHPSSRCNYLTNGPPKVQVWVHVVILSGVVISPVGVLCLLCHKGVSQNSNFLPCLLAFTIHLCLFILHSSRSLVLFSEAFDSTQVSA